MGSKRPRRTAGLTLVEIMVSVLILVIAVLGTSAFRYHASLGVREAELQGNAAQIAQLLCESWRGASDPNTFALEDALGSEFATILDVYDTAHGPYVPDGFTLLGRYQIRMVGTDGGGEISYWATLSWQEVAPGLVALNVIVGWNPRSPMPDYYMDDGSGRLFKLTTYITN